MSNSVFEVAGVYAAEGTRKGWIVIKEVTGGVHVESDFGIILSPDAARRFADQIYRLADHTDASKNNV